MRYRVFGESHRDTILLLHGGGLNWWNYREQAALLQDRYRVVLPILDGHAGSDRAFTTIEDNAAEILSFIDEQLGGSVLLLGGLSLGGQVALEMLAQRKDVCCHALIESASTVPSKLTGALVGPTFGMSYGLVRRRGFAKLQFRSLHIRPELFEDYYRDTCGIAKADMIAFLRASTAYAAKDALKDVCADVHVYVGEKETGVIRRSAEMLGGMLPRCTARRMPGLYHGAFSLNHAGAYADAIAGIVSGSSDLPTDNI